MTQPKNFEDDDLQETQWSDAARERVIARGQQLIAVLQAQLEFYGTQNVGTPEVDGWAKAEAVEQAAVDFAEAEFDLTGTTGPFGRLSTWDGDDDDDDELDSEPLEIISLVSVLQRADYGVVDEQAVLAAGRAAFVEDQPGQSEENARIHAGHLGTALYQIAHARGWDALDGVSGLAPLGSIIRVVAPEEKLVMTDDVAHGDADGSVPFGVPGEVLFAEENRYF